MSRSLYKLPYQHRKLFHLYKILYMYEKRLIPKALLLKKKYVNLLKQNSISIFKKSSIIRNVLVAKNALTHDGLFFQRLLIQANMVGFKFGQYIYTKRFGSYIHKDNKIAKKKAKLLKQRAAAASAKKKKKK